MSAVRPEGPSEEARAAAMGLEHEYCFYEFYAEGGPDEACRARVAKIIDAAFADLSAKLAEAEKDRDNWKNQAREIGLSNADHIRWLREEREKREKLVEERDKMRRERDDWKAAAGIHNETIGLLAAQKAEERVRLEKLLEAVRAVLDWKLPRTGSFSCGGRDWEHATSCQSMGEPCHEYSFGFEYGSNGEREYMRGVLRAALAPFQPTEAK